MVPAHAGGCAASLKLDLARVARRRSARRDRHSPADAGAAGIGGLHDNVAAGGGVALAADHLDVPAARRHGRAGVDEDVAALVGGGVGAVGGPGLHDHVAAVAAVQVAAAGAAAGLDAPLAAGGACRRGGASHHGDAAAVAGVPGAHLQVDVAAVAHVCLTCFHRDCAR